MKTLNVLALAVILSAAVATYAISQEKDGMMDKGMKMGEETMGQAMGDGMAAMNEAENMAGEEAMEAANEEMNEMMMNEAGEAAEGSMAK